MGREAVYIGFHDTTLPPVLALVRLLYTATTAAVTVCRFVAQKGALVRSPKALNQKTQNSNKTVRFSQPDEL